MSQQFLHRANIVTTVQHMGRETVPQGMRRRGLVNAGIQRRLLDRALQTITHLLRSLMRFQQQWLFVTAELSLMASDMD